MKLRNKKTGEILDYNPTLERWNGPNKEIKHYTSLADLNEDWEDYEEPAGYWYIDFDGEVLGCVGRFDEETEERRKEIGNYFETREEAEKAVEKLKAWKRLKDNGVEFKGWVRDKDYWGDYVIRVKMTDETTCDDEDLDLVFGEEE